MAVTLRDIAERTGVSPSVVSTVLSGRENGTFVSKDTRQRVLDVARQLNYVPVRAGRPRGSRRLRRQHTEQFIGVWSPSADRAALSAISDLQDILAEFSTADGDDETGGAALGLRLVSDAELPRLDSLGLAGLIVLGDIPLPRTAAAANIPCVQLGEPDHTTREGLTLHLDSFSAGQAVGEYLWQLGHRTLAFVAPASKPRVTRHRWQGLQSVWVDSGAPHSACVPAPYDTDKSATGSLREQAEAAIRKLYVAGQRPAPSPTAVVCFDEAVTAYVLQALHKLGKQVPEEVSVVTFGDSAGGAEAMSPPVTAVRYPLDEIFRTAVQELYTRSEGASSNGAAHAERREEMFAGELIVRESCASPRG